MKSRIYTYKIMEKMQVYMEYFVFFVQNRRKTIMVCVMALVSIAIYEWRQPQGIGQLFHKEESSNGN